MVMSTGERNTVSFFTGGNRMAEARRRFSIEQVRSLWELWKAGHTLEETSTALGVSMGGVHRIVDARGAVRTAEHFEDLALYAVLVDDLTWSTPR